MEKVLGAAKARRVMPDTGLLAAWAAVLVAVVSLLGGIIFQAGQGWIRLGQVEDLARSTAAQLTALENRFDQYRAETAAYIRSSGGPFEPGRSREEVMDLEDEGDAEDA